MKVVKLVVFCIVLSAGVAAWSQDFYRAEVTGDYSFARFYPVAHGTQSLSLNGGGGALVVYFNDYFGIKMDLQGYSSNKYYVDKSEWRNSQGARQPLHIHVRATG
jgi:hypothetical protein